MAKVYGAVTIDGQRCKGCDLCVVAATLYGFGHGILGDIDTQYGAGALIGSVGQTDLETTVVPRLLKSPRSELFEGGYDVG